jgi:hypothetical protein
VRGFWSYYCELMGIEPGDAGAAKAAAMQAPLQQTPLQQAAA